VEQFNNDKETFPNGPIVFLRKVIFDREAFNFSIPQAQFAIAVKLFETINGFPSVFRISPELLVDIPARPQFRALTARAASAAVRRIEEFTQRRVFPPMIQMIFPQLEPPQKAKTEEERLRKLLKTEARKTKRNEREHAKERVAKMVEAKQKKKTAAEATRRKVIAELEGQRTFDLNIAAVGPNGEKGKEEEVQDKGSGSDEEEDDSDS
jgi:hypothetical protein